MNKKILDYTEHLRKMKEDEEYRKEHKRKEFEETKIRFANLPKFTDDKKVPDFPRTDNPEDHKYFVDCFIKAGAIPKKDLVDGNWYYGDYRNARLGKWDEKEQQFHIVRYKFGHPMWDTCKHFEDDDGFALFTPLREATKEEVNKIKTN